MKKFILGLSLGTIGIAALSAASDIIINLSELLKAYIGVKITEYNIKINKLGETSQTRAIGFATTMEEEEEYDD